MLFVLQLIYYNRGGIKREMLMYHYLYTYCIAIKAGDCWEGENRTEQEPIVGERKERVLSSVNVSCGRPGDNWHSLKIVCTF